MHKEHVKQQAKQAERRNNLTPADLKQFLPGGGAIADQFSIESKRAQKVLRFQVCA